MQEQGDIFIVTFLTITTLEQPYNWTFRLSKYKDCIMCLYCLITGKNLARKARSGLDLWENKLPTSPQPVLRPVLSKTPLDTLPTLLMIIFQFSSSLWKWLLKNSLRRKLCHYLETSDFLHIFSLVLKVVDAWKKMGGEGCQSLVFFWQWAEVVWLFGISSSLSCRRPYSLDLLSGKVDRDGWREGISSCWNDKGGKHFPSVQCR